MGQKRYVYGALIVIFFGIIITSVYQLLGGFDEIKVYKLEPITRTIAGKEFYTHYADEAPLDFGATCRQLLDSGEISGQLVVVNYLSDSIPRDQIHQFIGVELSQETSEIPQDFEVQEFESGDRYAVFLSMHVLVQPRPQKIEAMLWQQAREDNVELQDRFFEIRYPDNSLSVEGWVK
ncbi:MAG: hypothetical protein JXR10_14180 [Cyclobacteriaceae bacterium]